MTPQRYQRYINQMHDALAGKKSQKLWAKRAILQPYV